MVLGRRETPIRTLSASTFFSFLPSLSVMVTASGVLAGLLDLRDGRAGQDLDAALLEGAGQGFAHVLVFERQEIGQQLDQGHL